MRARLMASFTQLNQLYTGKQSYHGQFEAETIEICIGNHTVSSSIWN